MSIGAKILQAVKNGFRVQTVTRIAKKICAKWCHRIPWTAYFEIGEFRATVDYVVSRRYAWWTKNATTGSTVHARGNIYVRCDSGTATLKRRAPIGGYFHLEDKPCGTSVECFPVTPRDLGWFPQPGNLLPPPLNPPPPTTEKDGDNPDGCPGDGGPDDGGGDAGDDEGPGVIGGEEEDEDEEPPPNGEPVPEGPEEGGEDDAGDGDMDPDADPDDPDSGDSDSGDSEDGLDSGDLGTPPAGDSPYPLEYDWGYEYAPPEDEGSDTDATELGS